MFTSRTVAWPPCPSSLLLCSVLGFVKLRLLCVEAIHMHRTWPAPAAPASSFPLLKQIY